MTMNYFLRNLPNPFEASAFAQLEDEQQMFARIGAEYGELLATASCRRFGQFSQFGMEKASGKMPKHQNSSLFLPNESAGNVGNEAENVGEKKAAWEAAWKSMELAAAPSPFGAMALAQTIVYRLKNGQNSPLIADEWPEHWIMAQLDEQQQQNAAVNGDSTMAQRSIANNFAHQNGIPHSAFHQFPLHLLLRSSRQKSSASPHHSIELVSLGLDCIFSVLLELNRRDPELCAQSLQSLLQLLQNMEPESLGNGGGNGQNRQMAARMHELLRELRREGNASVSAGANACMMSLAIASGHPDILYATIAALVCEPKRHLPHNQILADSNPLPRNVQMLAQSAQRLIIGGNVSEWSAANISLERRPLACEFDVIYTGSALISGGEDEPRIGRPSSSSAGGGGGGGAQGCLVSDGAYIYLLTQFGLLKMGTGLSETRAGEVLTCNELLKFADGSALFISNESLYLRRRHSSRLWVLDTDNLREIGEIMLPSALTTQGQLFADGRQFWHAQLDEQWHFACIPLDDSFGPCQQEQCSPNGERRMPLPSNGPTTRLMETEFCAFGEVNDTQSRLLQSIPVKLRAIVADVQLANGIGFLLSRCGKIFYAGPEAESHFELPSSQKASDHFAWRRLSLPEPIVQMALEPANRTLILRSGAGNLWMVGGGQMAGKSPKSPKKQRKEGKKATTTIKRIKVPNKRKCTSVSVASVGGGCLAYATENGRCFLLGRHVLNTATGTAMAPPPSAQSSPAKQTPFPVPGLENIPMAQVALGKTHLVTIGKNGAVYATGLNNQNQCGRSIAGAQENELKQQQFSPSTSTKPMGTAAKPPPPSSSTIIPIGGQQSSSSHSHQNQQQSSSSLASICSSSCSPSSSQSHQFCSQHSQHFFLDDLASRCARCGQCSVRGAACNFARSSIAPNASSSNAFCPCARPGPSCCLRCGLCRNCAEEKRKEKADNNGFGHSAEKQPQQQQHRIAQQSPKAVRLQLSSRREMLGLVGNAPLAKHEFVEEEMAAMGGGKAAEKAAAKIASESTLTTTTRIFGPERVLLQQQPTIKVASISVGNFHTVVLSADNQVYTFGANTHGQLGTGTTGSMVARCGAHKLALPANVQIVQAVAGANHTVLRTLDGRLVTFGAHKAGQLGRKRLAMPADDAGGAAAHSLQPARQWFAEPGFVPGFGQAYGRLASWVSAQGDRTLIQVQRQLLSRGDLAEGRISANGECLLIVPPAQNSSQGRPLNIGHHNNKGGYLMIRRAIGGNGPMAPAFRHFQWPAVGEPGNGLSKCSFCLDPKHGNLLWAYDSQRMCVFALSSSSSSSTFSPIIEMSSPLFLRHHRQMLLRSTELMVPSILDAGDTQIAGNAQNAEAYGLTGSAESGSPVRYSDCQLGLFLLSTVHSLCLAAIGGKMEEGEGNEEMGELGTKEMGATDLIGDELLALEPNGMEGGEGGGMDCRVVNRFENFGGGWGYSAHCVEAIQFKTNRDILFCGVGLFGGRGEYTARLKLFRVLEDLDTTNSSSSSPAAMAAAAAAAQQQCCVELLAETDEVLYECGARETAVLQLERPIPVGRRRWHVIWVQITGPSSDCGVAGKAVVRADGDGQRFEGAEEPVEFHFRPNALSNNGTNVEVGQIPELYFLTPSDVDEHPEDVLLQQTPKRRPMALRGTRKSGKADGAHGKRSSTPKCRLIHPGTLFDIRPKAIDELLRSAQWALAGGRGFLEPDAEDTLLDCDCAWRQERAALVAILAFRLVRLALCLLAMPLNGAGTRSEERLGPGQVLAFHRLLRQTLERKIQPEDQIGTFLLAEAMASYVICAPNLFIPSPELLRARISEQFGHSPRNSWLLALLCSMERLDGGEILAIFGIKNEKNEKKNAANYGGGDELVEAFLKGEEMGKRQEMSPQQILSRLFELAFAEEIDDGDEGMEGHLGKSRLLISDDESQQNGQRQWNSATLLQIQLKSSALRLLRALGQHLVAHCQPPNSSSSSLDSPSAAQIPLQTPSRFRHISAHPQWDVGGNGDAWDAIGLRIAATEGGVNLPTTFRLCGVGIFSGIAAPSAPAGSAAQMLHSFELELLQSRGGTNSEDWHLLERVAAKPDSFPTQIVQFTRQWPLQPDFNYTLRLRFDGIGKTLYGEGGHASLQLSDQFRLHFMPSGMSRNGSTVARGQFPFLIYSLAKNGIPKEGDERKDGNGKAEAIHQLFLQLLRQIVQILGKRMVNRASEQSILSQTEQTFCASILGQTNLLLEYRRELGFDIVAVMDEAISILAHINNNSNGKRRRTTIQQVDEGGGEEMDECQSEGSHSNGGSAAEDEEEEEGEIGQRHQQQTTMECSQKNSHPIWMESAHPYRAGQICIQQLAFASAHSLAIRFDPQCKTAQSGDCLWLYSAKGEDGGDSLFPIGRFSQTNWPWGKTLAVPGNKIYFLFEADQRAESELDENCFGFRCSIEPIGPHQFNQIPSNHSLERHFVWCLANACRQLVQIGSHGVEEEKRATRELLLNRHAILARRGIRVGNGRIAPSLGELLRSEWRTNGEERKGKECQFLEEFAIGLPLNSAGALLASAISHHEPFVHLAFSQLRFIPSDSIDQPQIRLGQSVEVHFIARDQHNREVMAAEGIEVEVVLTNGNVGFGDKLAKSTTASSMGGGDGAMPIDWTTLKTEQMKCQFRPIPLGRALYQCISMMPPLQGHSLEELRFSFAYGQPSKERLRLSRSPGGTLSAHWTPKRIGPIGIQCFVDGRPLASSQIPHLEVLENGMASVELTTAAAAPISPSLRVLRTQNPAAAQRETAQNIRPSAPSISPLRRAHFPSVSPYLAIRIRAHPSLSAAQIGQIGRGTWLDFTEILRNNDGVWLRLGEASRKELLMMGRDGGQQKEQIMMEAWVLQLNAHLQTEYLQMTPPSNGNFIVSPSNQELSVQTSQPPIPITKISILDSPKFRQKHAAEQVEGSSPSAFARQTSPPALGPALLEAFRWTFCALCWHSAGSDVDPYPTVEEMMEAANWLEGKSELIKLCQNKNQWNELSSHLQKTLHGWSELNERLWERIKDRKNIEKEQINESGIRVDSAKKEDKEKDGNLAFVYCELCGMDCAKPIGAHLRQRHPGCGGPSQSCGYNSAGQWTTGWSGQCGEGGQGNAVWYLLCAQCRQQYLRKAGNSIADENAPMAERLKRNALFLLELNRNERIIEKPTISIDPYPEAGPKMGSLGTKRNKVEKQWHSSDPGYQNLNQPNSEPSSTSAIANLGVIGSEAVGTNCDLLGAVLDFVIAHHDLAALRRLFRQSLLRATSFTFAFRLWNWLLKMASVEKSSHDVVWHFLAALRQFVPSSSTNPLLPHPAHLCLLTGPQQIGQMVQQFHGLLQELALILQSPREEGAALDAQLRCLCFRAWTIQLTGHEKTLLLTIRSLLSAVGNVLGCSSVDTTTGGGGGTSAHSTANNSAESTNVVDETMPKSCSNGGPSYQLQQLENLMEATKLEASSRAQLLGCLLDGSCETFWESGEEDRGRGKQRKLILSNWPGFAKFGAIYVNNAKDEGYRLDRICVAKGIDIGDKREWEIMGETEETPTMAKTPLMDVQLEKNFCGWIKFGLNGQSASEGQFVVINLWGDEQGCRVRQLCLFGLGECAKENTNAAHQPQKWQQSAASSIRPSNSQQQLLFGGTQGDAFALFQALATQVFGDDFVGAGEGGGQQQKGEGGSLREQVMDLLFSRSQLQPLQSFVGAHVSNAIEREVANLRAKSKRHFSYVSALLQMLSRMCSADPPSFVADPNLLQILSQLWLFAPEQICIQSLETCAKLIGQSRGMDSGGELVKFVPKLVENMLALVAKAITVQLKEKGAGGKQRQKTMEKLNISTHLLSDAPSHWCLPERLAASLDVAQLCIRILRQNASNFHAQMRHAVSAHLLRLSTHLRDSIAKGRPLVDSIRCPQFWLALASLGTMDGSEWLEAAPQFRAMRAEQSKAAKDPLCENHDDGRTKAQLHCQTCAIALCRECFGCLHLSRRNQAHRARLIGSALAPLPNANFHEGCHRLRIGQHLLILLNPKNLAGLVELDSSGNGLATIGRSRSSIPSSSSSMSSFRKSSQEMAKIGKMDNGNGEEFVMDECREESEGGEEEEEGDGDNNCHSASMMEEGKCRFCGAHLAAEQLLIGICDFEECRQKQADACPNTLPCGHWCPGIRGELQCGPCLHCPSAKTRQDADDLCAICLCERLGESPCLLLAKCQHIFHWKCLRQILEQKWPNGPRISFRFMQCPLCKAQIDHPALEDLLAPLLELQGDVARKARLRLEYEGHNLLLGNAVAGTSSAASNNLLDDQNALLEMALAKYIYVQCFRCGKAYFGGDARCQQQLEEAGLAERAFDPEELVCGSCAAKMSGGSAGGGGGGICGRHGTDFLEFKCRFCCSVAIYFCFGSTHFCAGCHGDFQRLVGMPKHVLPKCPAGPRGQQLAPTEPCPLQIVHPPAGEEFALGCGICRNLDTF